MAALAFDDQTPGLDPDSLKMPETPAHRATVELLASTARRLLGNSVWVFSDMNWYPTDGGTALAPDVLVLPRGLFSDWPRSYRQDHLDGPAPSVAVEVVSPSETFGGLWAKIERYRRLGCPCYVVMLEPEPAVLRCDPSESRLTSASWLDEPIVELGDLRITFDGGLVRVDLPDGRSAHTVDDLLSQADDQVAEAKQRVAELETQLRALRREP